MLSPAPLFTKMPTATFCSHQSFYLQINIATTYICYVPSSLEVFIIVEILSFRVVFLFRSLLFSFVILWWSITVEHVKWTARSFEQNLWIYRLPPIINKVAEEEGILSLKKSRAWKFKYLCVLRKHLRTLQE